MEARLEEQAARIEAGEARLRVLEGEVSALRDRINANASASASAATEATPGDASAIGTTSAAEGANTSAIADAAAEGGFEVEDLMVMLKETRVPEGSSSSGPDSSTELL